MENKIMSKKKDYMTKCEKYGLEIEKIFYKDVCKQKKRMGISLLIWILYFFIMNVIIAVFGFENVDWFFITVYAFFAMMVGNRLNDYISLKIQKSLAEYNIDIEICKTEK